MKNERIELFKKVSNGELTPEQADEQLLVLFSVSSSDYFDSDFLFPECRSTVAEPPMRLTPRIRSGTWKCSDCGYDYGTL